MPDPQAVFKKECRKRIARQKKRVLRFLLLSVALTLACGVMIGVSYLFRIRGVEITGQFPLFCGGIACGGGDPNRRTAFFT